MAPLDLVKPYYGLEISYQTLVKFGRQIGSKGSLSMCNEIRIFAKFARRLNRNLVLKKQSIVKSNGYKLSNSIIPL